LLSAYRHGTGGLSFMLDYFKCLRFSLAEQVGRSMAVAKRANAQEEVLRSEEERRSADYFPGL